MDRSIEVIAECTYIFLNIPMLLVIFNFKFWIHTFKKQLANSVAHELDKNILYEWRHTYFRL